MIQESLFWIVLSGSALVYWQLPEPWRLRFLAAVSAAYLLSLEPAGTAALIAWTLLFYQLPRDNGSRARRLALLAVLAITGYLAYFKYLPVFIATLSGDSPAGRVLIPLGISYYSFKLIHYALEARRGQLPRHSFDQFLCYMLCFPIFTAGPIERFDAFLKNRQTQFETAMLSEGLTRIAHGLIKKFLIAYLLTSPAFGLDDTADDLLKNLGRASFGEVWSFAIRSFLVFYLDFSAYTDIAVGSARLFGLRICENFNWPILATSIVQFWQRWHMSLSRWCQTYIYLPTIGLTRNIYAANYAAFLVMGLWHSASLHWTAWGLWHATGVAGYAQWTQFRRRRKWTFTDTRAGNLLGWAATMAWVCFGTMFTVIAGHGSLHDALRVLARMAGASL